MTLSVTVPEPAGWEAEAWGLLFEPSEAQHGWAVVGAQMVILHAAAHGVARPTRTGDVDVLVDLRTNAPHQIVSWLRQRGFELSHMSPDGIAHRFVRAGTRIDVLAMDHAGQRADKGTVPLANGRSPRWTDGPGAAHRCTRSARTRALCRSPIGWARSSSRPALPSKWTVASGTCATSPCCSLCPVDAMEARHSLSKGARKYLGRAFALLDDRTWASLPAGLDPREGRAAVRLLWAP